MATATGRTARSQLEGDNVLFHAHPQPMWVCDPATGVILAVNGAATRAYGYTETEFLAMTVYDLVADRVGDRVTHHRRKDGAVIEDISYFTTGCGFGKPVPWTARADPRG